MNSQESSQEAPNNGFVSWLNFLPQKTQSYKLKKYQQTDNRKFLGFRLLTAFSSVVIVEYLVAYSIGKRLFQNLYEKGSKTEEKKIWVNRQIKHLLKTMIRYNSIVFGTKVLFDEYYSQTLRQNELYYQSNSIVYYKIGALVGLVTYLSTIPINEFQSIKAINRSSANFLTGKLPKNRFQSFQMAIKQFITLSTVKRMLNQLNVSSLMGVVLYRAIYFGGYQKIKSRYEGPLNQYVIAPIVCSSLSLVVSPFDQIKILQMTSHKGKSFFQILNQKGFKLWNLPGQKIYTAIVKQSLAMSFFVAGQNLCQFMIKNLNQAQQFNF